MAEDYNSLKERFEGIRDERGLQRNTATRIGRAFLDLLDYLRSNVDGKFISKINNDTANGVITFAAGLVSSAIAWFKQGIKIGSDANSPLGIDAAGNATLNNVKSDDIHSDGYNDDNIGGEGYHVYKDANGQGHVCTDFLDVRLKARFTEVEIRRLSYVNADQVQSMAASKVEKVLPIGADGNVLTGSYSSSAIIAYRCLAVADDGSTATKNGWKLGDQARCQTFNITAPGNYTDVTNRLYWRLVVRIGQCSADGVILDTESSSSSDSSDDGDSKVYHFFDLANIADIAANDGAEFNEFFADPLTTGDAYHGYATQWTETTGSSNPVTVNSGNDAPAADDAVVQMGSQTDETRMGFFITKADGLNTGPYIYAGVNNFSLAGKMITKISPAEVLISARKLRVFVDPTAGSYEPLVIYRGDWTQGSTSYYYDEWDYQGSRWLCLYQGAEGTTEAPGTTPANWKEISLKGKDAIDGYFDYFHGVDYDGNTRSPIASASNLGKVDLLDYGSTAEDMIDIVEEYGGSYSWEAYGVELGSRYMRRGGDYAVYVATASGWLREGKNGAPAPFYTEEWYAWSNDASTANATTSPNIGDNSWEHYIPEQGSYAYLWKKTVRWEWNSTLKIYRAGNPQYYRLSGTNGTSIAVKGHVATTSNLPATHSDGDAYVVDADGHLYMWSDEANQWLDIGQFQGENGRTYYVHIAWATNVVYSEQTGEVTRVDGFVIAKTPDDDTHYWMGVLVNENSSTDSNDALLYTWSYTKGVNGTSPWIADLDNEMDSVACDADGHPVQINSSNQSVQTNFKLFHGSTEEKFYISSISPSSRAGATIEATPTTKVNAATSGSLTVTYNGSGDNRATIDGKDEFTIELTADSDSNIKRQLTFTVNGVRPGADGEDAVTYSIKPTVNSIAFARDANGNLTPNEVNFYLECEKSQGGTITNPVISHVGTVLYGTANAPTDADFNPSTVAGHHVAVWGNDLDGIVFNDTYKSIATVPNSFAYNQIYIALFKVVTENGSTSYILLDRETIPIVRDGAKGTDGKDGKDGIDGTDGKDGNDGNDGNDGEDAWTVQANPSPLIIQQSTDGSFPMSENNPLYIDFTAKHGNAAATVTGISNVSNNMGLTVTSATVNSVKKLKITDYNKVSGAYVVTGRITCTVSLSHGGKTATMNVAISVGVNLLGEFKREVIGDVETSVATKLTNAVNGEGEITVFNQVGTYIRSASEKTDRLTETVTNNSIANEKNLFGFTKGISYDGAVPFVQGYGFVATYDNSQQYGRIYNIKLNDGAGYYVVSCEVKVQEAGKIRLRLGDFDPVSGNILVSDGGVLKVPATTSWQKVVAVFNLTAAQAADSNGALVIRGGSSSNNVFIRYLQIERGSTPSLFGICADDAANNSEPMHVTWNQSPSGGMFFDVTSGNNGPGGTSNYTTNDVYPQPEPNKYPQNTGYIELKKDDLVMTEGVYTLSFWARANANGSVMECHCYDETNTETHKGVVAYCDGLGMEYGEIDPNQTEGMSYWGSTRIKLTTAWKKYYVHWYMTGASSKISVIPIRINGADTGGDGIDYYIAQIKLERGYVTSANRTVYETVMKQTARRMDFSVLVNSMEKAGIHMYTENNGTPDNEAELAKGIIELNADTTRVSNDLVVHRLMTSEAANEPHVEIYGSKALFFGTDPSQANIELALDDNNCAQLNFYDKDGNFMYGLGPSTIFDNMQMTGNSWRPFGANAYTDVQYSDANVVALANYAAGTCYKFIEGCKMISGVKEYNIGQPGNKSVPSDFDGMMFSEKISNPNSSYYLPAGYYIGLVQPSSRIIDSVTDELYSREVYQVTSAGGALTLVGIFYYRITSGDPSTAKLANADGSLKNCSSIRSMLYYMDPVPISS